MAIKLGESWLCVSRVWCDVFANAHRQPPMACVSDAQPTRVRRESRDIESVRRRIAKICIPKFRKVSKMLRVRTECVDGEQ